MSSGVTGRRSEDRAAYHPGRQDSSAAEGPFSPAGLKVLVVDDDPMCLKVVSAMLKRCQYTVETRSSGQDALALLRECQEEDQQFDLVLSDVYMPDIDGFKLLEHIALELDLPVIMMSSNGDTNVVLRGVTHGAVDFLIKPVRVEELRNVWQHVVRRRSIALSRAGDDASVDCEAEGASRHGTKRKENDMIRAEHEQGSGSKKPRVIWTQEMHQQFVSAVNQLGIDKAFPKRILDLMKVEGLTRENVASHLQKYRLYLKRMEGHTQGNAGPQTLKQQQEDVVMGGVAANMVVTGNPGVDAMDHENGGTGGDDNVTTTAADGIAAAGPSGAAVDGNGNVITIDHIVGSNGQQQNTQRAHSAPVKQEQQAAVGVCGNASMGAPQQQQPSGQGFPTHQQQHAMMGMANFAAAWQQQTMAMQAAAAAAASNAAMAAQGGMPPWAGVPPPPMMNPGFAAAAMANMQGGPPVPGMLPPPPGHRQPPMDFNAMMAAQQYQAAAAAAMNNPFRAPSPTSNGAGSAGFNNAGLPPNPATANAAGPRLHSSSSMPSFTTQQGHNNNNSLLHSSTHQGLPPSNGGGGSNGNNGHSASTTACKPGTPGVLGFATSTDAPPPPGLDLPPCAVGDDPLMPSGIDGCLTGPSPLDDPLGLAQPPKSEGVDAFFDMFLDNAHHGPGH